jgi:lariat debranching enzyme
MACPDKCAAKHSSFFCAADACRYKQMGSFSQYFLGAKKPHCLTVFIGGNHESSASAAPSPLRIGAEASHPSPCMRSYMHELPYGGWVAPGIFYLGYSGCILVGGLRIAGSITIQPISCSLQLTHCMSHAGWSGIYDRRDFQHGHHEQPPFAAHSHSLAPCFLSLLCRYQRSTLHSCYHVREFDLAKLQLLSGRIDIMLSHDWPQGVCHHGNIQQLLRQKPFLKQDIESGELGNPHAMRLLRDLRPRFWFAAHMHCKFPARVLHAPPAQPGAAEITQFLALDKV